MGIFNKPLELIRVVPPGTLPWETETLVVDVAKGNGKLRWASSPDQAPGHYEGRPIYLMLNSLPIAEWQFVGCPTCEQLLAVGCGRDAVDQEVLTRLRSASADPVGIIKRRDLQALAPLLQLLEPGLYGLACVAHYPTDGGGHFFMERASNTTVAIPASPDLLFTGSYSHTVSVGTAFLYPSQPFSSIKWEHVEHYRRLAEQGMRLGGLALHVQGALSVLLDGHHRATAACLSGQPVHCLTISRLQRVGYPGRASALVLSDGRSVPLQDLPAQTEALYEQHKPFPPGPLSYAELRTIQLCFADRKPPQVTIPAELQRAAKRYPSIDGLAGIATLGGAPTDDQIEELLVQGGFTKDAANMELVLETLRALQDARAIPTAYRLALDPDWRWLWPTVFTYLAANPSAETDDVFVQFCINDEGDRPEIRAIVDEYFRKAP